MVFDPRLQCNWKQSHIVRWPYLDGWNIWLYLVCPHATRYQQYRNAKNLRAIPLDDSILPTHYPIHSPKGHLWSTQPAQQQYLPQKCKISKDRQQLNPNCGRYLVGWHQESIPSIRRILQHFHSGNSSLVNQTIYWQERSDAYQWNGFNFHF